MTPEYIVLGVLLVIMGLVQTWLRHGPGGRALRSGQRDVGDLSGGTDETGTGVGRGTQELEDEGYGADGRLKQVDVTAGGRVRSGRVWEGWTAIMGGVGVILGIVLIVLGVLGR